MVVYEENPFLAAGEFTCAAKLIVANEQFCRQGWAELSWNIHGDFREHFSWPASSSSHSDQYWGLCECTLARMLFLHFATSIPYKHTKCSLYLLQFLTKTQRERENEKERERGRGQTFVPKPTLSHIETTNLIVWESVSLYLSGCRGVANCGNFNFFCLLDIKDWNTISRNGISAKTVQGM